MNKKNSVFAAACLVAGNGIGSGVMAIPFFVQKAGILGGVIAFLLSFTVTVLLHLMIAEVVQRKAQTCSHGVLLHSAGNYPHGESVSIHIGNRRNT